MKPEFDHKKHMAIAFLTGGAWIPFWALSLIVFNIKNTRIVRVINKKLEEADK